LKIKLPKVLFSLGMLGHEELPNLNQITSLTLSRCSLVALEKIPRQLQALGVQIGTFNICRLPHLANLLALHMHDCYALSGIESLMTLCPNVIELHIHDKYSRDLVVGLRNLNVNTLVLHMPRLRNIHELANANLKIVDLSACHQVVDFAAVKHVPTILLPAPK
jgi:hypothetical protein